MILHIYPDEKFTFDYIKRMNRLYNNEDHIFYVYYTGHNLCTESMVKEYNNVYFISSFKDNNFISDFLKSNKVICHSIFFRTKDIILLSKLQQKSHKKMIWALWGGDLYVEYRKNHNTFNPKFKIREFYRRKLIASFYKVLSTSDFDQMKLWYKTNAIQGRGLYSYDFKPIEKENIGDSAKHTIMVGHSATSTCCHQEAFEMLKKYKDSIEVYCPLSYPPNTEYINKVDELGIGIFGQGYHAMKEFMNYNEYSKFLNTIEVGIFNNDRQQGMGNIVNLLYLGKKVYMNKKNTLYSALKGEGFTLFDVEEIKDASFCEELTESQKEKNRKLVEHRYSDENFKDVWNKVFND